MEKIDTKRVLRYIVDFFIFPDSIAIKHERIPATPMGCTASLINENIFRIITDCVPLEYDASLYWHIPLTITAMKNKKMPVNFFVPLFQSEYNSRLYNKKQRPLNRKCLNVFSQKDTCGYINIPEVIVCASY